jgi:hypothetical protein
MAYTFNGPAKTITIGGTGAVTVTANDIYSRWVDWVHTGVGAGYDEVMRASGGEDTGRGFDSGVYVFLGFGWSLVVPAIITTLTVQGNVARDPRDASGQPLLINQGAALVILEVSAVALGYSSGDGGFTSGDRASLQSTRDRILDMNKALGREPGVSATVMDAAEGEPGYLVTSDGSVDQVLTLNNDGSVTIENAPD